MRRMLSAVLTLAVLMSCLTAALAEGETWVCAECGRENKASYQFCPACGSARLPTCGACGYELQEDELDFAFCPQCGHSLTEETPPEPEHPQAAVNDQPCPIAKDEFSTFYVCDLSWDSDVITAVSTLESATNMSAYADGSYPGVTLYPNEQMGLFPGLTDNCYMPLANIYPTRSGGWWLEFQIGPEGLTFGTAKEAADWFSGVWSKLETVLDLPSPSGILVAYPDGFTGEKTVRDTDLPGELLDNWAAAIDGGTDGIIIEISYNNMIISLEHVVADDGSKHISSWIILQPLENLQ